MTNVMTRPRPACFLPTSTDAPAPAPAAVRVGPAVTVVFEDRQTLWLRMQEVRRFGRRTVAEAGRDAGRELDWYQRLMPEAGKWTAAVWVGRPGCRVTPAQTDLRAALVAGRIQLVSSAGHVVTAVHLPHRNHTRLVGLVGWVEFLSDPAFDAAYAAPGLRWTLRIAAEGYAYQSEALVRTRDGFTVVGPVLSESDA
jgi:hypothetical protein